MRVLVVPSFRPGNLLNYDTDEGLMPTQLDWQDLKWLDTNPEAFLKAHSAIPITKESILMIGFVPVKQEAEVLRSSSFGEDLLYWLEVTFKNDVCNDIRLCWVVGSDANSVSLPIMRSNYSIHTLQNLFYDLSGAELEVDKKIRTWPEVG